MLSNKIRQAINKLVARFNKIGEPTKETIVPILAIVPDWVCELYCPESPSGSDGGGGIGNEDSSVVPNNGTPRKPIPLPIDYGDSYTFTGRSLVSKHYADYPNILIAYLTHLRETPQQLTFYFRYIPYGNYEDYFYSRMPKGIYHLVGTFNHTNKTHGQRMEIPDVWSEETRYNTSDDKIVASDVGYHHYPNPNGMVAHDVFTVPEGDDAINHPDWDDPNNMGTWLNGAYVTALTFESAIHIAWVSHTIYISQATDHSYQSLIDYLGEPPYDKQLTYNSKVAFEKVPDYNRPDMPYTTGSDTQWYIRKCGQVSVWGQFDSNTNTYSDYKGIEDCYQAVKYTCGRRRYAGLGKYSEAGESVILLNSDTAQEIEDKIAKTIPVGGSQAGDIFWEEGVTLPVAEADLPNNDALDLYSLTAYSIGCNGIQLKN